MASRDRWVIAACDNMPPLDEVVTIDLGGSDRPAIKMARLRKDDLGYWWCIVGEEDEPIAEPRVRNRLAAGKVWRWRPVSSH